MEVKAKNLNSANAKADATIDAAELKAKTENLAKKAAKNMRIDGFRQGKVPTKVIIDRYGKSIENDAKNELLADAVQQALKLLKKESKDMIGEPMVSKFNEKDGVIDAEIEISFRPDVKIDAIDDIMPKFSTPRVTKKEIDEKIDEFLKMIAPIEKIDKKSLEKGDFAKFDFEGFLDGVAFDGGKAENYVLEIGSNQFIPGFEDAMIGLKPGESKEISVTFPENYGAANLAGKPVTFKIKLHEIQAKKVAELNDETLKKLMPNDKEPSAEKLQNNVKEQIKNEKFVKVLNDELKPKFADAAVEKFNFDLPKNIVDQEIDMRFRNSWGEFSDDEKKKFQEDRAALDKQRETYRNEAERSVKLTFIIDEIAKIRKVTLSDQELVQAIYLEAYRSGMDPKKHLEYYKNQGMLPAVKMALIEEKLFNELFKLDDKEEKAEKSAKSDEKEPKKTTKSKKASE